MAIHGRVKSVLRKSNDVVTTLRYIKKGASSKRLFSILCQLVSAVSFVAATVAMSATVVVALLTTFVPTLIVSAAAFPTVFMMMPATAIPVRMFVRRVFPMGGDPTAMRTFRPVAIHPNIRRAWTAEMNIKTDLRFRIAGNPDDADRADGQH